MNEVLPVKKDAHARAPTRSRVSGMDRALQIIDYLLETGGPAGPYAIAKAVGAPLSTAYSIIDDLIERSLLSRRDDGTVWLGARLYSYGLAYARSLDFLDAAAREMHALRREVNETVQVCGRDGDHMIVLAMAEGAGAFRISSRVGTRVPLNWTASGRLLVGHLPEPERLEIFRHCNRVSPTGRAETDAAVLVRESRETFGDRLSVQVGASEAWLACIASPVCDGAGNCLATISIVVPEQKLAAERGRLEVAVRRASERIERALGAR